MIIEPLICKNCGAKLNIETDIKKYAEARKEEFEKLHKNCPSFPRPAVSTEAGRVS